MPRGNAITIRKLAIQYYPCALLSRRHTSFADMCYPAQAKCGIKNKLSEHEVKMHLRRHSGRQKTLKLFRPPTSSNTKKSICVCLLP